MDYLKMVDAAYRKLPVTKLNAIHVAQQVLEDMVHPDYTIEDYENLRSFIEGIAAAYLTFMQDKDAFQMLLDALDHISPRVVLRSV